MKKLLFIGIVLLLVMIPTVYATGNITYVSQKDCHSKGCDCYNGTEDYYYCTALNDTLNYNVKLISENSVRDYIYNTNWKNDFKNTQLIFLGNISSAVLNRSSDPDDINNANEFFNGIFSIVNDSNTTVFTTELNNYQYNNTATNILTRGFFFRISFVNFSGTNNNCSGSDGFEVITSDTVTTGYGENIKLYNKENNFTIYEPTSDTEGWIGFRCEPGGSPYRVYPVITSNLPFENTTDMGTFWGLNTPSLYTEDAWTLFYRTVWLAMKDLDTGSISGTLRTNKETYKPSEFPNITFQTTSTIASIRVSLTFPDGASVYIGKMIKGSDAWVLNNYKIENNAVNGTYRITLNMLAPGDTDEIFKDISIQPYTIAAETNKRSYNSGENVNITLRTDNRYNDISLNLTAKIDIINPNSNATNVYYGIIPRSFTRIYKVPSNLIGGNHIINITINDSDGRIFKMEKNFIVDMIGNLTIAPKIWNVQVSAPGNKSQLFNINNTGQVTLNLSIISDNSNITVDKTFLSIDVGKTGNFTGTFIVSSPGNFTGNILLNSNYGNYTIASTASFLYQFSANNLVISPTSISVVTVPGKNIAKNFELENLAPFEASNIVYRVSDSLKNAIILTNITDNIDGSGTSTISIKISSAGLSVGSHDGTIQINSSVGSANLNIGLEIIGDLEKVADTKLSELETLNEEITALKNKGKDVTSLNTLYSEIKAKLEDIKISYDEENYEEARDLMQEVDTSITELKTMLTETAAQKKNYGGIIWAVAIIVILIIVAVVVYKYKDQIISKLSKKQETNENYSPQSQGDYRTEYY